MFAVYCLYIVDKEQLGYVMGPTHRFIETNGIRGAAEADLEHDARLAMRAFLHDASGDAPHPAIRAEKAGHVFMVPRKGGMMANRVNPPSLPPWLTEADLEVYVDQFEQTSL